MATVIGAATTVVAILAAVACLIRAARRSGRVRLAWAGLGFGAASAALFGGTPGDPRAGYLALAVLSWVGLFALPIPPRSTAEKVRSLLDLLIIGTSLVALNYHLAGAQTSPGMIADIALATAGLTSLTRISRILPDRRALMVASVAMAVIAFASARLSQTVCSITGSTWSVSTSASSIGPCMPLAVPWPISSQ